MSDLQSQVESLAKEAMDIIESASSQPDGITAWDLKFRLKTTLSRLYLALGLLCRDGSIRISAEGLTYRVRSAKRTQPASQSHERPAHESVLPSLG